MANAYKSQVIKILLQGLRNRAHLANSEVSKPIILELMLTSKCNCRCAMCNIWMKKENNDLSLSRLQDMFSDEVLSNLKTITFTGGEPFLRKDIIDICRSIVENCKELIQLYISTNGSQAEYTFQQVRSILKIMPQLGKLRLGISFDHIGQNHDKIRGRKGIHQSCTDLIAKLKTLPDRRLSIQANVAIGPYNVDDLKEMYSYFKHIPLRVFWFPIMVSDSFYENDSQAKNLTFSEKQKTKLIEFARLLRKESTSLTEFYYYSGLFDTLRRGSRTFPCTGGSQFLQINAEGDVFPCYLAPKEFRFGNLREKPLKHIWHSDRAEMIRDRLKNCEACTECYQWYDGYALSSNLPYLLRQFFSNPHSGVKTLARSFRH